VPDSLPIGKPASSQREVDAVARLNALGLCRQGPGDTGLRTRSRCGDRRRHGRRRQFVHIGHAVEWRCIGVCGSFFAISVPNHDSESLCAGADQVLPWLTRRTGAVMPLRFGGHAVDLAALQAALPGLGRSSKTLRTPSGPACPKPASSGQAPGIGGGSAVLQQFDLKGFGHEPADKDSPAERAVLDAGTRIAAKSDATMITATAPRGCASPGALQRGRPQLRGDTKLIGTPPLA
jgi:hypothetical protein